MKNIVIKNDLFDISNRLKSIDKNYFVVFNTAKQKYEIHYKRAKNTYELTLPFNFLDARTIDFVQKTRMENKELIFAEMEKANLKIEAENKNKILNKIGEIYES